MSNSGKPAKKGKGSRLCKTINTGKLYLKFKCVCPGPTLEAFQRFLKSFNFTHFLKRLVHFIMSLTALSGKNPDDYKKPFGFEPLSA
jgi:hypothetical protein